MSTNTDTIVSRSAHVRSDNKMIIHNHSTRTSRNPKRHVAKPTLSSMISRLPDSQAQRARHLLSRLKQELKKLGHSGFVREDSQLAISFVSGHLDRQKWNLRTVATEIFKTSRLYEETNFAEVSHRIIHDVIHSCNGLVDPRDRAVVKKTAIHFMIPALKSVYTQLFSLIDAKNNDDAHQEQAVAHHAYGTATTHAHPYASQCAMPIESDPNLVIDLHCDDDDDEDDHTLEENENNDTQARSPSSSSSASDSDHCNDVEMCECGIYHYDHDSGDADDRM